MSEDLKNNQLDNVLSTTGGVAGQKLGLFAGEAVTQVAAASLGIGFGAARSPLGRLIASAPKSVINVAKSDKIKNGMSKVGSAAKGIASKVVDADIVQAARNDIARLSVEIDIIDGNATDEAPEIIEDDEYSQAPSCEDES